MPAAWTRDVVQYLLRENVCPRCESQLVSTGQCERCGAVLNGEAAGELRASATEAAAALTRWEDRIAALPVRPFATPPPAAVAAPAVITAPAERSSFSVQSVLAVAGAGLVAVAAIVFTFLNPDLTDFRTRTLVVGAITLLFLGGAWLLARRGLRFSAEAVAALGIVFLALDVWAYSETAPAGTARFLAAGVATSIAAVATILIGALARIRSWVWSGIVGAAIAPVLFGHAVPNAWGAILGYLAAAAIAIAAHDIIAVIARRFDSALAAERTTATALSIVAVLIAVARSPWLPSTDRTAWAIGMAIVLLAAAVLSAAATRNQLRGLFSFAVGGFAAAALAVLPLGLLRSGDLWFIAGVPAAAALVLVVLAIPSGTATIRRDTMLGGAMTVLIVAAVPAAMNAGFTVTVVDEGTDVAPGMAGVAVTAMALWSMAWLRGRAQKTAFAAGSAATASWYAGLALLAFANWGALPLLAQVAIGLAAALVVAALLLVVPGVRNASRAQRAPLVVTEHLLLVGAAGIAWLDSRFTVAAGAVAVVILFWIARGVARRAAPAYLAVGYAYALVLLATGLTHLGLEPIAVLCLVTTAAAAVGLAATVTRVLAAQEWYTVLLVTAVPFLIGVGSVVAVRSGWTALSTFVTFLLALTLVLTTRPGLNAVVRTVAAALLLPSLAVVVVCLSAEFLEISGSPPALIVIAVLLAVTLPSTLLIRAFLVRRGLDEAAAGAVSLAIEASVLVTAAIAVALALGRVAAGLSTALVVLLILAVGAAATARFARRGYGWPLAAANATGALWCALGLTEVGVVEAYLLPPALGATVVGAVLVARGGRGVVLYATGLACAAVPTLVLLALVGNGAALPLRSAGLLTAAVVLVALGAAVTRNPSGRVLGRFRGLVVPTLVVGMAAASSAAVQAVRLGLERDAFLPRLDVMVPVLALSIAGAVIAGWAAHELVTGARRDAPDSRLAGSRWLYVPAALILAVGPISAVHPGWFPILSLWALMAVLLATMIVTVVRAGTRRLALPPVWLTFALAWCTAVASWSERELRVEAFSLPLGAALLAAGVIAMRQDRDAIPPTAVRALTRWPTGFRGSWRLLAPGILVVFLASVSSTGTDPQTWRAILVIGLALVAILLGSLLKLAAPFIIGIVVLPIENIVVFAVQVGRSIGALPWWITLATAGAVLLVIAVTYERRSAGDRSVAARLRDLA